MEYNDKNEHLDATASLKLMVEALTSRQNEQSLTIADLRKSLNDVVHRMDEATHMTSEEYGQQVIQQIMTAMPAIQAEAMKAAKRSGRR